MWPNADPTPNPVVTLTLNTLAPTLLPGLPTGGLLGAKYGVRFPLLVSVGLCVVNFLMIAFVMPETLPKEKRVKQVRPDDPLLCGFRRVCGVWTLAWGAFCKTKTGGVRFLFPPACCREPPP